MIILPENNSLLRGLVGAWCPSAGPTGNVLRDLSGYRNNGVLTNMDASSDWVIDGGKYALDFDGSNDYVVANNRMVGQTMPQMTCSCWMLIRSSYGLAMNCNWINGFVWYVIPGSSVQTLFIGSGAPANATIPNTFNVWRHYWFSFDNGTTRAGYDGIQNRNVTYGITPNFVTSWGAAPRNNLQMNIGGYGTSETVNGLMDDVMWWNRVLSQNEIRQLYNLGRGVVGKLFTQKTQRRNFILPSPKTQTRKPNARGSLISRPPIESNYKNGMPLRDNEPLYPNLFKGLVGYWSPSAGPTGNRLRDLSGYNNHGTLTNMDAGTDWVVSGGKYALDFDVTNDYVDIGTRQYLSSGAPATVAWWERVTSSGAGYVSRFRLATGTRDLAVLRTDIPGYFGISTFNVSLAACKQFTGAPSTVNSVGIWRHFSLIMRAGPDATSDANWSLVVDGVQYDATAALNGNLANGNNRIGWDGADAGANCQIAEFAIFNRALGVNECRRLYQLGRGGMLRSRRQSQKFTQELSTTFVKKDGEWCETEKSYIKKNNVWVPSNPVIYTNGNWR